MSDTVKVTNLLGVEVECESDGAPFFESEPTAEEELKFLRHLLCDLAEQHLDRPDRTDRSIVESGYIRVNKTVMQYLSDRKFMDMMVSASQTRFAMARLRREEERGQQGTVATVPPQAETD
jgi:hypothetical protein